MDILPMDVGPPEPEAAELGASSGPPAINVTAGPSPDGTPEHGISLAEAREMMVTQSPPGGPERSEGAAAAGGGYDSPDRVSTKTLQ